jgi:Na+/proline symporter
LKLSQDVFQIGIIVSGLLAVLIQGLVKTDGMSNVWKIAEEGSRIEFFNFSSDPFERHNFWNLISGSIILWGSPYLSSQFLVHRCLCLDSLRKGKLSLYLNFIGQVVLFVIVSLIGLVLYSYFLDCDPVLAGTVSSRDALVPFFVLQEFADLQGVPGKV